jgi:hypothetical protein
VEKYCIQISQIKRSYYALVYDMSFHHQLRNQEVIAARVQDAFISAALQNFLFSNVKTNSSARLYLQRTAERLIINAHIDCTFCARSCRASPHPNSYMP